MAQLYSGGQSPTLPTDQPLHHVPEGPGIAVAVMQLTDVQCPERPAAATGDLQPPAPVVPEGLGHDLLKIWVRRGHM